MHEIRKSRSVIITFLAQTKFAVVNDADELMMITRNGQVVRIGVTGELREMGRATQGVRLIRLDADDILVNVARVAPEDKDDETPLLDGAGK